VLLDGEDVTISLTQQSSAGVSTTARFSWGDGLKLSALASHGDACL
jgi:hypothetical protein